MRAGPVLSCLFALIGFWLLWYGGGILYRLKVRPSGDIADIYAWWFGIAVCVLGGIVLLVTVIATVFGAKADQRERDGRED